MPVDGRAQVVHDLLADEVRDVGLDDAERARDDRDRDHSADEHGQQRHVLVRNRRVQHCAEQERRHDPEQRRDADQDEDDRQPQPVGPEQTGDATQVRAAHLGVGGACRRLARRRSHQPWPRLPFLRAAIGESKHARTCWGRQRRRATCRTASLRHLNRAAGPGLDPAALPPEELPADVVLQQPVIGSRVHERDVIVRGVGAREQGPVHDDIREQPARFDLGTEI